MSVKAINSLENTRQNRLGQKNVKSQYNQQFTGGFNPVVTVTDAISRGGFAASFIAQDGLGMVAPRIWEGLNRGRKREKDPVTGEETGKKIGPYNWRFARREGIREILSGPSAFLIPAGIMAVIKKYSGKANNVPVNMINTFSEKFQDVAKTNSEVIKNITDFKNVEQTKAIKQDFYKQVLKATLESSIPNAKDFNYDAKATEMAEELLQIENAKSKGFFKHFIGTSTPGMREDLTSDFVGKFMDLVKKYEDPTKNGLSASIDVKWRKTPVSGSFDKLIGNLFDYTDDAIKSTHKYLKNTAEPNIENFMKSFSLRRSGSRVLSNFGMFFAVVGFYDIIPKLYNIGQSENSDEIKDTPETQEKTADNKSVENKAEKSDNDKKSENIPFKGAMAKVNEEIGQQVLKGSWLKKLSDTFEFDGASMSVPAMLTLLFGFCLPPRLRDAKGEHDRREILVRDVSSFTAILFGAKALSRGFSTLFAKLSGLALNVKPADHDKGLIYKVKNYVTAGGGVNVLGSEQLSAKHSNLKQYKDEILGYIDFLNKNGGDPRKVFAMDKEVKAAAEEILNGKNLKDVSLEDLEKAFKKAKEQGSAALDKIYKAFEDPNNKFVRRAKTLNSSFEFASIILLVPAFMIWLARYCERMTARNKAKAQENIAQNQQTSQQDIQAKKNLGLVSQVSNQNQIAKVSMAGFINKK